MTKGRRKRKRKTIIERTCARVTVRAAGRARLGAAQWQQLDFPLQHQHEICWCWAAVATSVAHYYKPHTKWTQCTVANAELGRPDCCGAGAGHACNVIGDLVQTLRIVGHLARHRRIKATFGQAEREVLAGRPLGARVQWLGGGGHYVTIVGFLPKRRMLAIDDPYFGRSHLPYRTFCRSYLDHGAWTDSYYTKA
jgi:hypothetical protein